MHSQRSDAEYREEYLGDLPSLPTVGSRNSETGFQTSAEGSYQELKNQRSGASTAGNEERQFLKTVKDNPGRPSSAYPKLARISVRKAITIRKRLVDLELIRETKMNAKSRGRAQILIEPTEKAFALFAREIK